MAGVREGLSGGKQGAHRQLVDELKAADYDERQKILKEAGITPEISPGEGLAMKAELALPWRKLQHLRRYECIYTSLTYQDIRIPLYTGMYRWLKKWGVKMGSERRQRQLAQQIAPYPIEAESVLFSFTRKSAGEEFRTAAMAYIEDLSHLVQTLLAENKR